MYPLHTAEKIFILNLTCFSVQVSLHLLENQASFLLVQRSSSLFSLRIWTLFLLAPFASQRPNKWYVILHYDIWHFLFDNLVAFEKISGLAYV